MKTCNHISVLMEQYDFPFYVPIQMDNKSHALTGDKLAIKLGKATKSGNLSRQGQASAFIKYCPFCGEELGTGASETP